MNAWIKLIGLPFFILTVVLAVHAQSTHTVTKYISKVWVDDQGNGEYILV